MSQEQLLSARSSPTEHLRVDGRAATINTIVESNPDGSLRVVVQGFMATRIGFGKNVALDGFYKLGNGSVAPMPKHEFYEFD